MGIGTTGPNAKLELDITARTNAFNAGDVTTWGDVLLLNPTDTLNAASGIGFKVDAEGYGNVNSWTGIAAVKADAGLDHDLVFVTRQSGGASAERVRITNDGKVGIGTTGPGAKLHIDSTTSAKSLLELSRSSTSDAIKITNFNGTNQAFNFSSTYDDWTHTIPLMSFLTTQTRIGIGYADLTTSNGTLLVNGTVGIGTLSVGTAALAIMSGNVGIGVTAPLAKLHIDQSVADAAIPVLSLDQADISDGFINFIGATAASAAGPISSWTTGNSIQGFVRVEINGVQRWIAHYSDPTG